MISLLRLLLLICLLHLIDGLNANNYIVASFGPQQFTVCGNVVYIKPLNACEPFNSYNNSICVAERENCTFIEKAINAQNAGCNALIVFDDASPLIQMSGQGTINIPCIFTNSIDQIGNYTCLISGNNNYGIDFVYVICGFFTFIGICIFCVCCRQFYKPSNNIIQYNYVDVIANINETCSICLDNYIETDAVIKIISCEHIFHKPCIERWLKNSNSCPQCRSQIYITIT